MRDLGSSIHVLGLLHVVFVTGVGSIGQHLSSWAASNSLATRFTKNVLDLEVISIWGPVMFCILARLGQSAINHFAHVARNSGVGDVSQIYGVANPSNGDFVLCL